MTDDAARPWLPDMDYAGFEGGPADGAIRLVDYDADGQPPPTVVWRNGDVVTAPSDLPAPSGLAIYQLVLGVFHATVHWVYRYVETLDEQA
ncbi:MAG TPA: hypothetical protein VJT31_37780 [Rugosimonospora sp.]|nr:hypothetical protein [Rugosimonospora sp.]